MMAFVGFGSSLHTALLLGLLAFALTGLVGSVVLLRQPRKRRRTTQVQAKKRTGAFNVSDPFSQGSYQERRGSLRRRGKFVAVVVVDGHTKKTLTEGSVLDRSMGGLCLHVEDPLEPGQLVKIKPSNQHEAVDWVWAEIRSCQEERQGYKVGCQFTKAASYSTLLQFG